jgi:NAD(P)H-flavin reductase
MNQTSPPPAQEVIQVPNKAHARTESSASSDTASTTDEKRHSSSSTASYVKHDTKHTPSSSISTVAKEKGHRHTYSSISTSTYADLETQLDEVDDFSQKRLGFVRYTALNVYRRLFSLAFIGNAIGFILLMIRGAAPLDLVNASAINLVVCGLCRHPLVVNMLFLTFGSVPRSAPMRLRRLACKIFHLGGVHSGTGVAACVWYIGFSGLWTYQFQPSPASIAVLVLVWLVLAFLLAIIAVAHPAFRAKRHDYFELTHRFSNWIILLLFWVLIFLLGATQQPSLQAFLLHLPAFWILVLLTLATIHPWLLLRRVPVVAEPLSPHAVRLHFAHATVRFGQGISVARHPLADWHSFASFTDQFDHPSTKFSCLVSKAGDWTRQAIAHPPTHLWKRGVPTYGFGYVFRMFARIIVVTTGSGIGPCLSFIEDARRPAMRVVWQTKDPHKTYGPRTLDLVRRMDEEPVVIDTSVVGRMDMLPVVLRLYKEFGADAVCVISNPKMTKSLVYRLETRGIAAYGPIFDS